MSDFTPTSIVFVENFSSSVIEIIISNRSTSKDIAKSNTGEAVEITMNLLVFTITQLFIEKESDIIW